MQVRRAKRGGRFGAVLTTMVALALLAAACGGGDDDESPDRAGGEGEPQRGGTLNYALGGETSGGYCLPEAQLASGIAVATAIYDTLTVPNQNREYIPNLADSVQPNEDYTEWTISLRDGITFHDGSPLDAEVVKNNLDAYRGEYPARSPLLFLFVFDNIADVAVVDPMSVRVTTKVPWVAFPAYLYASGRLGMMAQAQLDDAETCDRELIGTGPFEFGEWVVNDHLTVTRNPNYWQEAPDGEPYPYLDGIEFRPISEEQQRVNAVETGTMDVIPSARGETLETLLGLEEQELVQVNEVDPPNLVGYVMLNASEPPFDDADLRRTIAHAYDVEETNEVVNSGLFDVASGPFGPGGIGFVEDPDFPRYDPEEARRLVGAYEDRTGQPVSVVLSTTTDQAVLNIAELVQGDLEEVGIETTLKPVDEATIINDAIGGNFEATLWTNSHAAGDPDEQQVWWQSESPVNFGRIDDPAIDRALEEGRSEPDPDKRQEIYEAIPRAFAENVWNVWSTYTTETVTLGPTTHGLLPPELVNGDEPFYLSATGFPKHALWKE